MRAHNRVIVMHHFNCLVREFIHLLACCATILLCLFRGLGVPLVLATVPHLLPYLENYWPVHTSQLLVDIEFPVGQNPYLNATRLTWITVNSESFVAKRTRYEWVYVISTSLLWQHLITGKGAVGCRYMWPNIIIIWQAAKGLIWSIHLHCKLLRIVLAIYIFLKKQ